MFYVLRLYYVLHISRKINVANTNDVCDVSAQHSIRTFSGLRNLFTRQNGFKIGCLNIRGLLNKIDEMRTIVRNVILI